METHRLANGDGGEGEGVAFSHFSGSLPVCFISPSLFSTFSIGMLPTSRRMSEKTCKGSFVFTGS